MSTYSGTFDMTSSSVTIHGWQDNRPKSKASIKYQIVIKSWTGDDLKGEKIIADAYYPKDGTWYSEKISTLMSYKGVQLKMSNASDISGARGAGNVYQD